MTLLGEDMERCYIIKKDGCSALAGWLPDAEKNTAAVRNCAVKGKGYVDGSFSLIKSKVCSNTPCGGAMHLLTS